MKLFRQKPDDDVDRRLSEIVAAVSSRRFARKPSVSYYLEPSEDEPELGPSQQSVAAPEEPTTSPTSHEDEDLRAVVSQLDKAAAKLRQVSAGGDSTLA